MATIRPYKAAYWDTKAIEWAYFDAVTGDNVVHNGSTLVFGTDNTNPAAATYYAAIKFDHVTEPAWVSDGPIADAGMALMMILSQIVTRTAGLATVAIGDATGAWDSTFTAAQMRGVVGGFGTFTAIPSSVYGVPVAWIKTKALPTYGFIIRVTPASATLGGVVRIATDPAPVMRYFYQYTPTTATRSDATERETLDASTLRILASREQYDRFEIGATVKVSDRLPAQTDIDIDPVAGTQIAILSRTTQWPDSDTVDIPASGSIPVSLTSTPDLDTTRGMLAETSLTLIKNDGTEVVLAKAGQYVGDITYTNDGLGELELRSILAAAYNSRVVNFSVFETATVNYIGERAIFILTDLLMNCSGLKYDQIHYNNIPYLIRRFAGVWTALWYTQSDPPAAGWLGLTDKTVGDVIAEIGVLYNLVVSQTANGCISLWHPSVYRTSMRVWTIDEDDCLPGGYKLTKRGMEKQYGSIKVSSDGGSGAVAIASTTGQMPNYLPSDPAFNERIKSVTAHGQSFVDYGAARAAVGRQLSQRYTGRYWEVELSLSMAGLAIDNGDVIKLTGTGLSALTRFLVIAVSGDPSSGQVQVTAVHYPDVLSVCNTFEDDGIQGKWRWLDETGAQDVTNMSPSGTDDDPTTTTLATLTYEHWQGVMHSAGYAEWSVPLISASLHDVIDVCTMVTPDGGSAVTNYASWGDDEYMPIMVWRKASGVEAMAVGWYRPGYGSTLDPVLNTMFVGHIVDYTAGSFTFTAVAYSAAGVCGREAGTSAVPAAIALQWDDDSNVNLYVDRSLVATGTGFSKADWTTVRILSQTYMKMGCVRHMQTATAITELQRLQGLNGLDCYQP